MIKIPEIKEELDWQIYFAKDSNGKDKKEANAFVWTNSKLPLTFRSAYPYLKELLEPQENSANVVKSTKNEFIRGHRKQMFSEKTKEEIVYKYTHFNTSKSELAREYKCSEKTIRNIVKQAYFNTH